MENKIKKVTFYYDSEIKKYTSFVEIRENGDEKTVNNADQDNFDKMVQSILTELKTTYNLKTVQELKENGYVVIKQAEKKTESGISNFISNNKKLIAVLTAGFVIVGVGSYHLGKNNTNNKTYSVKPNNKIEETQKTTAIPTVTPTPSPTPVPTKEPVDYVDVPFINQEYQDSVNFNKFGYEEQSVIALRISENGLKHIYTENNYDCSIDNLCELSRESTNALFLNVFYDGEKPKDVVLMNYQYLFTGEERAYVEYFSKMRNKIVQTLFLDDRDKAREIINMSAVEIVRCISDNEPIQITLNNQTVNVYYDNLSSDAKRVVLELASEIATTLNRDNFEYKGEVYDIVSLSGENGVLTEAINEYTRSK